MKNSVYRGDLDMRHEGSFQGLLRACGLKPDEWVEPDYWTDDQVAAELERLKMEGKENA